MSINENPIEIPTVVVKPAPWQQQFAEFSKKNPEVREMIDKTFVLPDRRLRSSKLEYSYDKDFLTGNMSYEEFKKHESRRKHRSIWSPTYYDTNSDLIYKRFLDVYKAAGTPKIKVGKGRAYYKKFFGKSVIGNINTGKDVLAELAHPIEGSNFFTVLKDLPKTLWGEFNTITGRWDKYWQYRDPSHYEYRTHEIVEPALEKYIRSGTPIKFNFDNIK